MTFSASQLREHGFWLYSESNEPWHRESEQAPTASQIRLWFGDLSSIRVPSRYAARMGQVFSSTISTIRIEENQIQFADDVWDDELKYLFSDGVGTICPKLARKVMHVLRIGLERTPSAFLIRFAGAKGVLSVHNTVENKIVLRKSTVKFFAAQKELEVVDYSKRLPFLLNRQIIVLLEGLGVDAHIFVEILDHFVALINTCPIPRNEATARKILRQSSSSGDHYLRNVERVGNAMQLLCSGFTHSNRLLYNLRTKARIPLEHAMCAIGIMNEIGVLKSNEIFVQYSDLETHNIEN